MNNSPFHSIFESSSCFVLRGATPCKSLLLAMLAGVVLILLAGRTVFAVAPVDSTRYVVGPGDVFNVEFFESQITPQQVEVSLEGLAQAPSVGSFPVAGLTLTEAKRVLAAGFKEKYSGVAATITLKRVRQVRILVSGAVMRPGLYEAPATALVSDIIALAGGLLPGASRRNIVIRTDKEEHFADLEMFTRGGITEANPALYLGDVVFVPQAEDSSTWVFVSGEVRSPGSFEYTGRDRLLDLVRLGGGLSANARADSALLSGAMNERVAINSPGLIPAGAGALVFPLERREELRGVYVSGEAVAPGRYSLVEEMSVSELIRRAGGMTDMAYPEGIVVYNNTLAPTEFDIEEESMSGAGVTSRVRIVPPATNVRAEARGSELIDGDFRLLPGDSVVVPARKRTVAVLGEVKSPGLVRYSDEGSRGEISLSALLAGAGGLTGWADYSSSYLSRRFSGAQIPLSANPRVLDGDVVYVARKRDNGGGGILSTVRDIALISAGAALTVFAIDEIGK